MNDRSAIDPSRSATSVALAGLPRRLAAIVYDSLLLIGVLVGATALALGLVAGPASLRIK